MRRPNCKQAVCVPVKKTIPIQGRTRNIGGLYELFFGSIFTFFIRSWNQCSRRRYFDRARQLIGRCDAKREMDKSIRHSGELWKTVEIYRFRLVQKRRKTVSNLRHAPSTGLQRR